MGGLVCDSDSDTDIVMNTDKRGNDGDNNDDKRSNDFNVDGDVQVVTQCISWEDVWLRVS